MICFFCGRLGVPLYRSHRLYLYIGLTSPYLIFMEMQKASAFPFGKTEAWI